MKRGAFWAASRYSQSSLEKILPLISHSCSRRHRKIIVVAANEKRLFRCSGLRRITRTLLSK